MSELLDYGDKDLTVNNLKVLSNMESMDLVGVRTRISQAEANFTRLYGTLVTLSNDIASWAADGIFSPAEKKSMRALWSKITSDAIAPIGMGV